MRLLKRLLPLLVLLLWGTTAKAQYNPTDPPEPGVNFTLSTRSVPANAGYSFSGAGTHAFGSNINMRVSTNTGYRFICWENEEGTVVSTSQNFTYTMPAKDVTLIAHFEYNPASPSEPTTPVFKNVSYITFRINPSEAGYMSDGSNGEYEVGSTRRFTVRANSGYKFVNWTRNNIEIGTSPTLEFTVPSGDHTLVANFLFDPTSPAEPSVPRFSRSLNLLTNLEGAGSLSGGGTHEVGSRFTVSARANTYYHFENWTDEEGNVVSETASFTYTMPDRNVTLTANYSYNFNPSSPGEPGVPDISSIVPEDMVSWPRMGMFDDTHVQILCETPGASIHYTLDGSIPTKESPIYTDPVLVGSNLLVRAIAYKEGMKDSPVVSYQVTVYRAATPVFTFEGRKINISSATPGAIIRYTTDFTDPTEESEIFTDPFEPEENCRIKAYASKSGLTDSPINIFVFRHADYVIPAPLFSIDEEGHLVITPAVSGGRTYYTLDGTDPTASSPLYTEPLIIDGNFRIRAYTVHPNFYDSPIGEFSTGGFQVETPTYSYGDLALTLASATSGATLHYTLDGTVPSEESAVYSSPLRLTEDCKVVARGFKENYEPSDTISYTFVLADHKALDPELIYDPATLTVTMTCATGDVEIRYTIDGEPPTATIGMAYEGPVSVVGNHVYRARAFRSDLFASDAASVTVDDQKVKTPISSYAAKLLTLSCPDADATIHYTTDGTDPTSASDAYTEPLPMSVDCTVRFIAVREHFLDSDISEYMFKVSDHQVMAPAMTFDSDAMTVKMTCATEDAEIRYTIDGEAPAATTGTVYDGPIAVDGNHVYRARAFRSDMFDSEVGTLTVNDQQVPTPTASFGNRLLTLDCSDKNACIHYTTDGSLPTLESTLYIEPIALTTDCIVRFIGLRDGYNDSEIGSFEFRRDSYTVMVPTLIYDAVGHLMSISCATEGAEIRFTIDGSEPTATSGIVFTQPVAVKRNLTFKAIATRSDLFDSRVATHVVDSYKVDIPKGSFDVKTRLLTLTCDTAGASISYAFDKEGEWSAYSATERIRLRKNGTVYAKATLEGYNDSDVAEIVVGELPNEVLPPEITCTDGLVEIHCATEDAVIRYSLDDVDPDMESPLYEKAFTITRNTRVNAFAYVKDLDIAPSSVSSELFDIFKVSDLHWDFNSETRELTLSCDTEGAKILYTFNPAGEWSEYIGPIQIRKNCTLYAKGVRDGYYDSETVTVTINSLADSVPVPEISFADGLVTITCIKDKAEIHYTIDDEHLTVESPLYTATFRLERNATVRAFALIPGLDIEPSDIVTYVVDSYKVATPYGEFDPESRLLRIKCATAGAAISYTFDRAGEWTPYTDPISITRNRIVYARASFDGYNDSEIGEITVSNVKCAPVSISYNGRYVSIVATEPEASIRYSTDGSEPSGGVGYVGEFDAEGLCTIRAVAIKPDHLNSDVAELLIDRYADEDHAETSAGGILESCFDWSDPDLKDRMESFSVEGILNDADYGFIRSMRSLRHLDIEKVRDAHIPDNAFTGQRLISISLPSDLAGYGENILSGAGNLSSVIWNSRTMNPDGRLTDGLANPNVLIYVTDETVVAGSRDLNVIQPGKGTSVALRYGFPYYAARDFRADRISLSHEFTQTTKTDTCRGWETIVLPFEPTAITHEFNGPIVPFAAWNGDVSGDKPFWLYRATAYGWEAAYSIEACVPYIISMPNNPDYVEAFNLGGKVTFSATDVDLGPESGFAYADTWNGGTQFEGTFLPVEEKGLLSLNVNAPEDRDMQPGSAFVADAVTLPFGAYVRGASGRKAMPLFGDSSDVDTPLLMDAGLTIETPAPGVLKVSSGRERKVAVTTATGATIRTLHLRPGDSFILEGLTRDLYIVGGRKVMVR